jgi:hypothetical protein
MRYFAWNGMEKTEIKASSIAVVDDNGCEYELHFRETDREVSLSVDRGQLVIEPRASNVVRISCKK